MPWPYPRRPEFVLYKINCFVIEASKGRHFYVLKNGPTPATFCLFFFVLFNNNFK